MFCGKSILETSFALVNALKDTIYKALTILDQSKLSLNYQDK